jgi:predicted kinase
VISVSGPAGLERAAGCLSEMMGVMDPLFVSSPAVERLCWLLDGLAGRWPEATDATAILAPGFASVVTPQRFVAVMRERAAMFAPFVVIGFDAEGESAVARFRTRDGELWVARVTVETDAPHRVVLSYAEPWVPQYLTAALPGEFAVEDLEGSVDAGEATLVVFGGVPGSGKSAVAERVGAALDVPVFALDWLLGALSPFGMRHRLDLMSIGSELLTTLAYRELFDGRSAIIDTTSEDPDSRARWESLATAAGATFLPVVCVCSDPALHRERVERRQRGIPGWADAGDWPNVRLRRDSFPPWFGSVGIDTVLPLGTCVTQVLESISTA